MGFLSNLKTCDPRSAICDSNSEIGGFTKKPCKILDSYFYKDGPASQVPARVVGGREDGGREEAARGW